MKIVQSELAVSVHTKFIIKKWPTKKRRRGWYVLRQTESRPCAYVVAEGTIIAHPSILQRIKDSGLR